MGRTEGACRGRDPVRANAVRGVGLPYRVPLRKLPPDPLVASSPLPASVPIFRRRPAPAFPLIIFSEPRALNALPCPPSLPLPRLLFSLQLPLPPFLYLVPLLLPTTALLRPLAGSRCDGRNHWPLKGSRRLGPVPSVHPSLRPGWT